MEYLGVEVPVPASRRYPATTIFVGYVNHLSWSQVQRLQHAGLAPLRATYQDSIISIYNNLKGLQNED